MCKITVKNGDMGNEYRLCILGSGQMGASIAQLCILRHIPTTIVFMRQENFDKTREKISNFVMRQIKKSATGDKDLKDTVDDALRLLTLTTDLEEAILNSSLVIETIVEESDKKVELFREIQEIKKDIAIATNTSAISITSMAKQLDYPEYLCGLHFFIPVHVKKFVELPISPYTSPETIERTSTLVKLLGKNVVKCKDAPGFVVNRLFVPMLNAAHRLIDDGVVEDLHQVDEIIKDCLGWKMGPFEVSDIVGLESLQNIIREIGRQLPAGTIVESPVLKQAAIRQKENGSGFCNQTNGISEGG